MVNFVSTNKISVSVLAVLFITLQVANASQAISFEDFLHSIEDAVAREAHATLKVSRLPKEVLNLMREELYENKVLKEFSTTTKHELTRMLINDMSFRKSYYKRNKKIFKSFITKTMDADIKNYPDENSGIDANDINFLSLMTTDAVNKIITETIAKNNAAVDDDWKVLTLVDAFRTVYFYCKYPKEMAPFLTEEMRVEVKEWLDSMPTWGAWGFDDDAGDEKINVSELKFEL